MKTKIITIVAAVMFLEIGAVQAGTVWLSGHHEIVDGDIYGEIYMYNDATAEMFDGDVYKMEAFDISTFEMLDGVMDLLFVHDSSTANIHGGNLDALRATEEAQVNLYAYDVTYHETGGHYDRGWIEGRYIESELYFNFDFVLVDSFSHISVVPEPSSILLLVLGGLLIRRRH
jgi:hypothetical protein